MSDSSLRFSLQDLLDIESLSEVSLSPNGEWVAFVLGKSNKPDKDTPFQKAIHIINVNTRRTHLIPGTDSGTNNQPCWSPDSSTLAFISNRDGASNLYLADADGGNVRRLTNHPALDSYPAWQP